MSVPPQRKIPSLILIRGLLLWGLSDSRIAEPCFDCLGVDPLEKKYIVIIAQCIRKTWIFSYLGFPYNYRITLIERKPFYRESLLPQPNYTRTIVMTGTDFITVNDVLFVVHVC